MNRHTRSGLGPHVVGTRVVVRRVVRGETGPSGGPAMTDVLGVCESWDDGGDGACVVMRDDGTAVRIALADIVSGKPVPPRPSVRARVSPREAQRRADALFPDMVPTPLGEWVLRECPSVVNRRANSVLAFGPSGVPDDVATVLAHYDRPVAAVLAGSEEESRLHGLGWVPESTDADSLYQLAGVARVARALAGVEPAEVTASETLVTATVDDRASGVAVLADDWLGLRAVTVDPDHRRQGLALRVLAGLVGWGAERGAATAYLQVLADNGPALALYERLGFRTHHAYRYLTPPHGG